MNKAQRDIYRGLRTLLERLETLGKRIVVWYFTRYFLPLERRFLDISKKWSIQ